MKKYYFLIIVALILSLVLTGCFLSNVGQVPTTEQSGISGIFKNSTSITPICINFEAFKAGKDVTISGTVWDYLKIGSSDDGLTLEVIAVNPSINGGKVSYNTTGVDNGCLNGVKGFGPVGSGTENRPLDTNNIIFEFKDGVTVSTFSIEMFDYGDYIHFEDDSLKEFKVTLIAHQKNGNSIEVPYIITDGYPSSTKYDACRDGKYIFTVTGEGIEKVELKFEKNIDIGVGFDDICFTPETNKCSTKLLAGQDQEVGEVIVEYTLGDDFISVEYSTEAPWLMEEIHFHASFDNPGNWGKPVVNKAGNPAPGHFLKVFEDLGGKNSHSFEIPLSEIDSTGCGSLYFAAHAKVYWIDDSIAPVVLSSEAGSDKVYLFKSNPNLDWSNYESGYPVSAMEVSFDKWDPFIDESSFGAEWISDEQAWLGSTPYSYWWGSHVDSWRLFVRVFDIPLNAVNIVGTLEATADNEEEVYLNDSKITPPIDKSTNWKEFSTYDLLLPVTGDNKLEIMAKNNTGTGYNPTGLIYKLVYQYDLKYEETAWGKGTGFPRAKNWSMYFECPLLVPCPF